MNKPKRKRSTKKKGGKGKRKGGAFENKVCKLLSLWVSNDTRDDLYCRSATSGGRATVRFQRYGTKSVNQAGDITCIDTSGDEILTKIFCIECKSYKDLFYHSLLLLKPKNKSFVGFWKQTCDTAQDHDRLPLLIAKSKKNAEIIVGISYEGLISLNCSTSDLHNVIDSYSLYSGKLKLYLFTFDEFVISFKIKTTPKLSVRLPKWKLEPLPRKRLSK
jgi:hypothetical protein